MTSDASSTSGLNAVLGTLLQERRRERTVLSTSADRAAQAVREQVVEGKLRSGTRLPEERLAAALGVSRNTLREALSQLVAERILVRQPHRGVVVATPELDDVADVYRVRRIIEPSVLRSVEARDRADLTPLDEAIAEGREAASRRDWGGVASANQHFHRAVVSLAGSPRLDTLMDLLLAEMRLFFNRMGPAEEFHGPYLEENAAIAGDLARGRREAAAQRMEGYLLSAERQLTTALSPR
jgi:DNA-binding GntR family transcriptional regulator